jgi:predicted acylesterase/phospholipase RssA
VTDSAPVPPPAPTAAPGASADLLAGTPEKPLGDVAMSLSGGGYRAAGFHLGALGLLHDVGLLDSVADISTVSGGSIVGAAWVASMLDELPFTDFRERFRGFLLRTNVITQALNTLRDPPEVEGGTYPSLIRAAARLYADPSFLGDRRFSELWSPKLKLREVIFNSTEFRTGGVFRFRRSLNPHARIGSGRIRVPRAVADHVRLADVVAASSCFPGAFEPFRFPHDFTWPADYPLDAALKDLGPEFQAGLPMMDGGIFDNQGISSLLTAFRRTHATTLLVSDTSPRNPDLYPTAPPHHHGWMTMRMTRMLGILLFALSVLTFGTVAWNGMRHWTGRGEDWLLYVVPGAMALGTAAGLLWLRERFAQGSAALRKQVHVERVWNDIRDLTVAQIEGLAETRVTSMVALTSSVFMARIRSLVYDALYKDPRYEGRRMACLIYGLEEDHPALFGRHPWLRPGKALVSDAAAAAGLATTLWFDNPGQLQNLEKVGAATACFVLLRFVLEHRWDQAQVPGSPVAALLERLKERWAALNEPSPPAATSTSG